MRLHKEPTFWHIRCYIFIISLTASFCKAPYMHVYVLYECQGEQHRDHYVTLYDSSTHVKKYRQYNLVIFTLHSRYALCLLIWLWRALGIDTIIRTYLFIFFLSEIGLCRCDTFMKRGLDDRVAIYEERDFACSQIFTMILESFSKTLVLHVIFDGFIWLYIVLLRVLE